ncbi:F0F1 ATP synthase subunit delta [Candidatus Gottesmanbacteria bacterium]|nr:F0F1 ATP synthase subunit delta [Candidatus Gottesmanbacteria bacterium]
MARLPKNEIVSGVIDFIKDTNDLTVAREVVEKLEAHQSSKSKEAVVISSSEIDIVGKQKLEKKLKKDFGDKITIVYKVESKILGGIIIQVGDWVYDNSVSGQLENFKQTLYGTI